MKVNYYVIQDDTREVFKSDSWNDCIEYLKTVKEEYDYSYMVRFNEKDGTLLLQDITTGNFITSLSTRIVDEGKSPFDTYDIIGSMKNRMEW